MQALRAAVARAGLAGRRGMTTAAQLAAEEAKPKGSIIDTIGVYTAVPAALGVFVYDIFIHPEEEFEGEVPPYPYMRIRTRDTHPWGERGLFEVHRHVAEKHQPPPRLASLAERPGDPPPPPPPPPPLQAARSAARQLLALQRAASRAAFGGPAGGAAGGARRCASGGAGADAEAQSAARRVGKLLAAALPLSAGGALWWRSTAQPHGPSPRQVPASGETVVNWSATHTAQPTRFYQPESQEDVEAIVADCAAARRRLRVVGSGLSPNGVGFSDDGMLSMALLDRVLWVDPASMQVRVEAGCRVQQVADALKPYGLSLQNYASIREQQIGGFTQVSAHGTGAGIPPVDAQVVSLKLVTPGQGVIELSAAREPELFALARVGLGCLGVVTELTLQAVPAQRLRERTFVASGREVAHNHAAWLRDNRHLRYMWLPYTDSVVVVQVNPEGPPARPSAPLAGGAGGGAAGGAGGGAAMSPYGDVVQEEAVDEKALAHRLAPLRQLLASEVPGAASGAAGLSATELRDALLALRPLDRAWVARVNAAEAEFWKRSSGTRVGWADQILGFDCGGQQWVLEVAFPIGRAGDVTSPERTSSTDLAYMRELLRTIEAAGLPAHAPIEQRWTASSASPLSPAAAGPGTAGPAAPDTVHSWVGIIMYLPSDDPGQRAAITDRFREYADLVQERLMPRFGATWHWAKIEAPTSPARLAAMRAALAARFPLGAFAAARARLDPHNVLGSEMLDQLLGPPGASGAPGAAAAAAAAEAGAGAAARA
ncbi:hypothetical protein HT031_001379 [Scenedesmus sp. PABB004]|nr:hypothetical protein HT031_001379 [Scenedesmus sp. PABB004]